MSNETKSKINSIHAIDQIKSLIKKADWSINDVARELNKRHETNHSLQNFSNKLAKGTLRYLEFLEILDIIGYEVEFVSKKKIENLIDSIRTKIITLQHQIEELHAELAEKEHRKTYMLKIDNEAIEKTINADISMLNMEIDADISMLNMEIASKKSRIQELYQELYQKEKELENKREIASKSKYNVFD